MATYTNRSKLFVKVKQRDDLYREFSFHDTHAAQGYLKQLRAGGHKPLVEQLENTILVRIRAEGQPDQTFTAGSYQEAENIARRIDDEQHRGLFIDYSKSLQVTPAALIERYIREECPRHKAGAIEAYKLNAFLEDSRGELNRKLAQDAAAREHGEHGAWTSGRKRAKRTFIEHLEWLHRPFAWVQPTEM